MYTIQRTNQGGSVAVFVIVSVILAAGVVGGLYALQKRGDSARSVTQNSNNAVSSPVDNSTQTKQDDQKKADEAKKQADAQQKVDADKKAQADKQAAAQKQAQADAEKKQQQAAADQKLAQEKAAQDAQKQAVTTPQTNTAQTADKLPTTGPEDMMPQAVIGGLLVAAVGAYLKSYRHRYGSILR